MDTLIIEGVINSISGAVSRIEGGNNAKKGLVVNSYDYIEIDGKRWKNVIVTDTVTNKLTDSVGKKVKIHYTESYFKNPLQRYVAGIEDETGNIESVMIDDVKPTAKMLSGLYIMLTCVVAFFWTVIGGAILSIAAAYTGNDGVCVAIFVAVFSLIIYCGMRMRRIVSGHLRVLADFAEKHDKSF